MFYNSTFSYKNKILNDSCRQWNSLTGDSLSVPSQFISFSSVRLIIQNYDLQSGLVKTLDSTCSDINFMTQLIRSLQSGSNFRSYCEGNIWQVLVCNGISLFCVNCKISCSKTEICPGKSFVINPCMNSCRSYTSSFGILDIRYEYTLLYPQFTSSLVAKSTDTSIGVAINMSKPGVATCAAFPRGLTPLSVFDIKSSAQSKSLSLNSGASTLNIANLNPSSEYSVLCYTIDFMGNAMNLQESVMFRTIVSTTCCKKAIFSIVPQVIYQFVASTSMNERAFTVKLNSPPINHIILQIHIAVIKCDSKQTDLSLTTDTKVYPSRFSFFLTSETLFGNFIVRGSTVGCYSVIASTIVNDSYLSTNASFVIQRANTPLAPPVLTNVLYYNDGFSLIFSFDSPTDYAISSIPISSTYFNCSRLVLFPSSSIASCRWSSSTTLIALLDLKYLHQEIFVD